MTRVGHPRRHYHYHSFPRRWRNDKECNSKALSILGSLATSGLLLTPEVVVWPPEFKAGIRTTEGSSSYAKRACFTYLMPSELPTHATEFGPFAIEFENWELRILGGIPVFYVPADGEFKGFLGMGASLTARIADFQALLERLELLLDVSSSCKDKSSPFVLAPTKEHGLLFGPWAADAKQLEFSPEFLEQVKRGNAQFKLPDLDGPTELGGTTLLAENLLRILTWGIQSYSIQLAAIRGIAGYFYPSERIGHGELLSYYRQREWRVLGGMTIEGVQADRKLTEYERSQLLQLDNVFFSRPIRLRSGASPAQVDECSFLTEVDGKPILSYAKRIVCPREFASACKSLLRETGFGELPVEALEDAERLE